MFLSEGPAPIPLPHEKFFAEFYEMVPGVLQELFPGEVINFGMISIGNRSEAKITFRTHKSHALSDHEWSALKERLRTTFDQDIEASEALTLEFIDQDRENKNYQTLVLTKQ